MRRARFGRRHALFAAFICFCLGWWVSGDGSMEPCPVVPPRVVGRPPAQKAAVDAAPVPPRPVPLPPSEKPTPKKTSFPSNEDIHISECDTSDIALELQEGKRLQIDNQLIDSVIYSRYGSTSNSRDTKGLINAFIIDRGLDLIVSGGALGGNVLPKGTNTFFLTFKCKRRRSIKPGLSADAKEAAEKTRMKWKNAASNDKSSACNYKKDLFKLNLPDSCRGSERDICFKEMKSSIMQYADDVGTEPFSYLSALECQLSTLNSRYTLSELRRYAEHHHTVWLLKIDPRPGQPLISWDANRKPNTWKFELQTFSMFQFSVAMIERGLKENPGIVGDKPVFLLINALDEPLMRRQQTDIPNDESVGYMLRKTHQAEHIVSPEFLKEITQWGDKSITSCQTINLPILSWSGIPGWHTDIIVPNKHPGSCHGFFFDPKISAIPFEQKSDTVLFRAFSVSCDPNAPGPRHRLACLAKKHKDELKFGSTTVTLDIGGGRGYGPTGSQKFLAPSQQANCKYLLLLDGVVAAFRSTWLLQSNSLILATGAWKDVRTQLLKPWIHYIPFSLDLSDFEATMEFIVKNPDYAKWVTENAKRAGDIISGAPEDGGESFDTEYFSAVIQKMPQFTEIDSTDESSIRWTTDRNCASWEETQGRIKQCLPNTHACPNSVDLPNMRQRTVAEHYFSGGD